jgi:hypothetical protein
MYCMELSGVTGLDTFKVNTRAKSSSISTYFSTQCPYTTIVTASFSLKNDAAFQIGGVIVSNPLTQIGGLGYDSSRGSNVPVVQTALYKTVVDSVIASIAFSGCPTTASSCATCSCGGNFCQSADVLVSPGVTTVSPQDSLLVVGMILKHTSVVFVNLTEQYTNALIQGYAPDSNITLDGTLHLTVASHVPLGVFLPIVEANSAKLIGNFASVSVVSTDPCFSLIASSYRSGSSLSVLLLSAPTGSLHCTPKTCATDPLPCVHGFCQDSPTGRVCACPPLTNGFGFSGMLCDSLVCLNSCSGVVKGSCVVTSNSLPPSCVCSSQWGGVDCSVAICSPSCENGGSCVNNVCNCSADFQGVSCESPLVAGTCPDTCGAGNCTGSPLFACDCLDGYSGLSCQLLSCPNDCNGNGVCVDGSPPFCSCSAQFSGVDCSDASCLDSVCLNNGTCYSSGGFTSCACSNYWTGSACQVAVETVLTGNDSSSPLSNGAIAGIVIASLICGVVIAFVVTLFWRRQRTQYMIQARSQILERNALPPLGVI